MARIETTAPVLSADVAVSFGGGADRPVSNADRILVSSFDFPEVGVVQARAVSLSTSSLESKRSEPLARTRRRVAISPIVSLAESGQAAIATSADGAIVLRELTMPALESRIIYERILEDSHDEPELDLLCAESGRLFLSFRGSVSGTAAVSRDGRRWEAPEFLVAAGARFFVGGGEYEYVVRDVESGEPLGRLDVSPGLGELPLVATDSILVTASSDDYSILRTTRIAIRHLPRCERIYEFEISGVVTSALLAGETLVLVVLERGRSRIVRRRIGAENSFASEITRDADVAGSPVLAGATSMAIFIADGRELRCELIADAAARPWAITLPAAPSVRSAFANSFLQTVACSFEATCLLVRADSRVLVARFD